MNCAIQSAVRGINCTTKVTFPSGALEGLSRVVGAARNEAEKVVLLLEETPFHPVDTTWPDQREDRGSLDIMGRKYTLEGCEIFAVNKESGEMRPIDKQLKRDRENWIQVVGHIINPEGAEPESFVGQEATASVDGTYRKNLSIHHSATHLAAFALNLATKEYWKKKLGERDKDSLDSPDFDSIAMNTSYIFEDHSEDSYRFSTSIKKKKGLDTDRLFDEIKEVEKRVNEKLAEWISSDRPIIMEKEGEGLSDMRKWVVILPEGKAVMPCGGTHMKNLSQYASIKYSIGEVASQEKGTRFLRANTVATLKD